MTLSRNRILYLFLITSFYISLFLPIIEGIFRQLGESYLTYIKVLTQGYIFLLPIFVILLTNLHTKRFYNSDLFKQKEIYNNVYQTIAENPNGRIIKYETL